MATDSIRKLNYNTIPVGLHKFTIEDEHDNCMIELSPTVCNNIGRWGDPKIFHIVIRKAIR